MNWHLLETNKVISLLNSSEQGLSNHAVLENTATYGANELQEQKRKPLWLLFLAQFGDFMILILIVAAIVSGLMGDVSDTIIILMIVMMNAIVGFVQEFRAGKAMQALKKLAVTFTKVIRNGRVEYLSSVKLVPGDIVILETGNLVPADLRLTESFSLCIDESSLTGESVPVDKISGSLHQEDLALGDRKNMAFKGTPVVNGRGAGIVVSTGMETEIGKIARLLQEQEVQTPLQRRMSDFGKKLSWLVLIICVLLFTAGLLRGEQPIEMLLVAISLGVAAIPEALPALITISLARGASRLVHNNVLIRKLPAVETLGSISFICSDKTGTLTENRMEVVEVISLPSPHSIWQEIPLIECAMALNHDAEPGADGIWLGESTELALLQYVIDKNGENLIMDLRTAMPRVAELPFNSDRKCMTTMHKFGQRYIIISKGAAESIELQLKQDSDRRKLLKDSNLMAVQGKRVIAYGYRFVNNLPSKISAEIIETDMEYAGLACMIDPPREEVKKAISECKAAGIKPVMITGDHRQTAIAIAKELGILGDRDLVMSGSELDKMQEEEFESKVERVSVYARVSPQQKLTIIRALQKRKHFIAMTGDGVNDAPSLRAADIGIAMGITGTDVSKEAAHMILLDDNFATIVKAVKEGRRIYDNIRKFVKYIMTCNSAEILTIFLAPLMGLPIPLLPIHILWINLVTDGLPGLALSYEKAEKDIMKRPPRPAGESLFAGGIASHIIWVGAFMSAITLATQAYYVTTGNAHWQTMVFTVLSLSQLGHVFAIRGEHEFIFRKGLLSNVPLVGAIVLTLVLQLGVIYLPVANEIFKTQPLEFRELILCLVLAALVFHAVEFEKWIRNKSKN